VNKGIQAQVELLLNELGIGLAMLVEDVEEHEGARGMIGNVT